jgi:hypothetical protein
VREVREVKVKADEYVFGSKKVQLEERGEKKRVYFRRCVFTSFFGQYSS